MRPSPRREERRGHTPRPRLLPPGGGLLLLKTPDDLGIVECVVTMLGQAEHVIFFGSLGWIVGCSVCAAAFVLTQRMSNAARNFGSCASMC